MSDTSNPLDRRKWCDRCNGTGLWCSKHCTNCGGIGRVLPLHSCGECGGDSLHSDSCSKVARFQTKRDSKPDPVNHPSHYTAGTLEVIDAIEGLNLGFHAGNVVKYVARYKLKGGVEDLRKAEWYLRRLIELETKGDR